MAYRWIPKAAVKAMHGELLAEHGGLSGSPNEAALDSTLARPQQRFVYGDPEPTIFELAACYGFGFAKNHVFPDGNKRTALVTLTVFLRMNGYMLTATEEEAVSALLQVASSEMDETTLSVWVEKHSSPLS
ncbi:MAG: type II toxin-antitoxin system death-on-curing family toxin [Candidatus Competibacteraceae bacterium]|nr:type II toxin-antitoxin system death-on-curing family toxin [Candidatus Competibacteraceae bacterium]